MEKLLNEDFYDIFNEDEWQDEDEVNFEGDDRLKNFAWLGIAMKLAMDDITKLEEIFKLNFILCMNVLLMWKIRESDFNKRQRLINLKNKAK